MSSLKKYSRAISVGFVIFAKRQPFVAFLILGWLVLSILFIVYSLSQPPEQARVEQASTAQRAQEWEQQQAQRRAAAAAKHEETVAVCRLKSICKQFARARQECATAGSFETCMRVKLGDDKIGEAGSCTNDGHVAYASAEPSAIDCFLSTGQ
jgi:hypothetical protein